MMRKWQAAIGLCIVGVIVACVHHTRHTNWIKWWPEIAITHEFKPPLPPVVPPVPVSNLDCDVKKYKQNLNLSTSPAVVPVDYLANCTRVFYNRVPKCASRTMRDTFKQLGDSSQLFQAIYIDGEYSIADYKLAMNIRKKEKNNSPFVLTSHHFFIDPTNMKYRNFVNINIIREPLEWFMSMYFWTKYGSVESNKIKPGQKVSGSNLDGCVTTKGCVDRIRNRFGPISFLCGRQCSTGTNMSHNLEIVLQNLKTHYLVVGIQEELPAFAEVLEYLLPHMFHGLPAELDNVSAGSYNRTKAAQKDPVDEETRAALKDQLQLEYTLYNKVKDDFMQLYNTIQLLKHNMDV